jgi:hypothetical protein
MMVVRPRTSVMTLIGMIPYSLVSLSSVASIFFVDKQPETPPSLAQFSSFWAWHTRRDHGRSLD